MSLSVPENPSSNSPSKPSSIRKTSVNKPASSNTLGPTTHFAAEHTAHHFLPHSPPNQTVDYEESDDEQENETRDADYDQQQISYQHPQPQQPFQPFFTLIEDRATHEHYHPTVHYIFADDEPDIITEAACRSLQQNEDHTGAEQVEETASDIHRQERSRTNSNTHDNNDNEEEEDPDSPPSRLPPLQAGIREHYLILDIHPTSTDISTNQHHQQSSDRLPSPSPSSVETAQALLKQYPFTVTSAQSLSADWQILRTSITDAPTMNSEPEHELNDHLMLRVEGRGNSPDKDRLAGGGNNNQSNKEREALEEMVERFQTRLAEIRHLLIELPTDEGGHGDVAGLQEQELGGPGETMFTQGGLVSVGYQPTGFGNAVLDEQD